MQNVSRNGTGVDRPRSRLKAGKRNKRPRQSVLETLESRVVMSYTFSYNPFTQTAQAIGSFSKDQLVIEPVNGFLEHSVNGSPFSGSWGFFSVPAKSYVDVNVLVSGKDGSSVILGTPAGPASNLNAQFNVIAGTNTKDTVTIDDSAGTKLAAGPFAYKVDTGVTGTVTGPGINYSQASGPAFGAGVALLGSSVNGDTYFVSSVFQGEPFTIVTARRETAPSTSARAAC